ncbi:C6 transcription factor [Pyrenophora seminiperda CCB06]|uniref:C6 transcription factor n=1 Tax=Pyrenophora seminiperda CCB06 TaxID=1302712 RepID=A0A3M7MIX2_9PLEO|nr:C6 transcription factor [Pyrenophora seminiperda CCB06]
MVLGPIGDFLEESCPANYTTQPPIAPRTGEHVSSPAEQTQLSAVTACSGDLTTLGALRQRRGHTKSRLGCLLCKKRKIKCQETWPSCANCDKRGYVCEYPDVFKYARRDHIRLAVPSPHQVVRLVDTPTVYSPDDMHLFHHYLISAYPCIPHDFEEIWTKDVPKISHQYPYLMDAMLALAGSHLAVQVDSPKTSLALQHRQKAIVGLENAFSRWPATAEESHVMLAASYLLSFQSSYMEDGFLEHYLSLRGCSFLSQLIISEGFDDFLAGDRNLDLIGMDTTFRFFPEIDQEIICEALLSLQGISGLIAGPDVHDIEKALVGKLVETLRHLLHSDVDPGDEATTLSQSASPTSSSSDLLPFANPLLPINQESVFQDIDWANITTPPPGAPYPMSSFVAFMAILTIFSTWPHDALVHVFDPSNQLGNIVLVHFIAIRFVLSSLSVPKNALKTPTKAVVDWLARIISAIDEDEGITEWPQYVEWPRKILQCMQACVERNKGLTLADVRDMVIHDPGAFKEGRAGKC